MNTEKREVEVINSALDFVRHETNWTGLTVGQMIYAGRIPKEAFAEMAQDRVYKGSQYGWHRGLKLSEWFELHALFIASAVSEMSLFIDD